jgi:GNAT superfamily N-acetyltransferase
VRVRALGWRTELALRALEGASVAEREDHLIVRSPANPGYRWGNYVLFYDPPAGGFEALNRGFESAFPGADYLAVGVDSASGETGSIDAATVAAAGAQLDVSSVLCATRLRPPRKRDHGAELRPLGGDRDWARLIELRTAIDSHREESSYEEFIERQMASVRGVCERGRGAWFGAFRDGEVLASLGIFDAGGGRARYQSVDTHPRHRRQGLASGLVFAAAEWARAKLGTRTLVIGADPDYFAIDIYRALGFSERERHVAIERAPAA